MTDNLHHDGTRVGDNLNDDYTRTDGRIETLHSSTVVDADGDKIGGVGQVYLDDATNQPTWVTVHTGFLGLKETFVPLAGATYEGDTIRVPYQKDFVKDAPAIDPDGHLDVEQEDELYRYYNLGQGVATDRVATDRYDADRTVADRDVADVRDANYVAGTDADRRDVRDDRLANERGVRDSNLGEEVVVHEERLNVGKEQVETGRARIRKHVVTETQHVPVEVRREELVVERTPVNEVVDGDHQLAEGEHEVVLHEERPVIQKETVATEKVSLGTREVVEQQNVQAEVSKEEIEVDHDGVQGTGRGHVGGDNRPLGEKIADATDGRPHDGENLGDKIHDATDGNPRT